MISEKDSEKMKRLAQEGKPISKIWLEDFPHIDYWEIYVAVHGKGQKSATGIKRMITNRLKRLDVATDEEKNNIISEIHALVWHLYNNFKQNQKKLENIRNILSV